MELCGVGAQPVSVVAGDDQQLRGGFGADAGLVEQPRGGEGGEVLEVDVELDVEPRSEAGPQPDGHDDDAARERSVGVLLGEHVVCLS